MNFLLLQLLKNELLRTLNEIIIRKLYSTTTIVYFSRFSFLVDFCFVAFSHVYAQAVLSIFLQKIEKKNEKKKKNGC
jgi:hypothetical protein